MSVWKKWLIPAMYFLFFLVVYVTLSAHDTFEKFYAFSRLHEDIELDELVLAVAAAMLCLCLYVLHVHYSMRMTHKRLKHTHRELERTQHELRQLAFAKDEFLSMACHELKTPLNGIMGALMLVENNDLDKDTSEGIMLAKGAAGDMKFLINDILELSDIKHHHRKPTLKPFPIRETLDSIVSIMRAQVKLKGLELELQVDSSVPEIIISHEGWIRLTVLNILGNAAKFTRQGGITLRCRYVPSQPGGKLFIEVSDTGEGIAPADSERIFQPYSQKQQSSSVYAGMGLGLYVVKEIMDRMNAEIQVTSRVQQGTTFTMIFPITQE